VVNVDVVGGDVVGGDDDVVVTLLVMTMAYW
jgi:hypothetical protein